MKPIDVLAVLEDFTGFYFDTALSGSPAACRACLPSPSPATCCSAATGRTRRRSPSSYFTGQLDAYAALDRAGHEAIDRANAEALWPRFASTTAKENA